MATRLPNVTKNPSVSSDYLPEFNRAAAHLCLPERFPSGRVSWSPPNFASVYCVEGLLETYCTSVGNVSSLQKSWLRTRRPPCGCENSAASTSSVSVCLIHPDTDTFYSGWDQHFLWHLTLSHTNVTNPSCARPNSSAGNSWETGPPTPTPLGQHHPSPQRRLKPDRDGPSTAPCPLLTLGHARRSSRPPPPATDLSVPALATLLPAAQSTRVERWPFPAKWLFVKTPPRN